MADEILLDKRDDGIGVLTLNRPHALNAMDRAMVRHLRQAIRAVEDDPDVGLLIVTGAGGKAFCVGIDLKERAAWSDQEAQAFRLGEMFPLYRELEETLKPSIAVVDGHCLGGGFEIALTCDMIVATHRSRFGLPEAKWGLIPAAGGARKLPHLIGMARAKEMILTGQGIPAERAEQWGLVNRVAAPEETMQHAIDLGRKVLENVQVAVRAAKRSIDQSMDFQSTAAVDLEASNSCYADSERKHAIGGFAARKSA